MLFNLICSFLHGSDRAPGQLQGNLMDGRGGAAVRLPLVQSQHGPAGGILGDKEDHLAVQGVLPLGVGEGDQIYPRVLELPGQGGVVLRQKGGAVLQPQDNGKTSGAP